MKWHYFLILTIVLLSSCIPEEPPIEEDPKAKGIYECFIDGEEYKAFGPNFANQWSPNPHARYTELSGGFQLSIDNRTMLQSLNVIPQTTIKSLGKYVISPNGTRFLTVNSQECDDYFLPRHKEYYIDINELNIEYDIIVGSFSFELVRNCDFDTISVHGSFDLEYSL